MGQERVEFWVARAGQGEHEECTSLENPGLMSDPNPPADGLHATKCTVKDVARKAGVSTATVSRVLCDPQIVSSSKRMRVLDAISRLRYCRNEYAAGLARKKAGITRKSRSRSSPPSELAESKAPATTSDETRELMARLNFLEAENRRLSRLVQTLEEARARSTSTDLKASE